MHPPGQSIPRAGWREFALWLLRLRSRFTVTGASMFPILKPGDQVLLARGAYRRRPPAKGDIVVAEHPLMADKKIVKRVSVVHPDGRVDLQGENPFETTDFRSVPASKIIGKVTSVFYTS